MKDMTTNVVTEVVDEGVRACSHTHLTSAGAGIGERKTHLRNGNKLADATHPVLVQHFRCSSCRYSVNVVMLVPRVEGSDEALPAGSSFARALASPDAHTDHWVDL